MFVNVKFNRHFEEDKCIILIPVQWESSYLTAVIIVYLHFILSLHIYRMQHDLSKTTPQIKHICQGKMCLSLPALARPCLRKYILLIISYRDRDSSVGIVTGYGLDGLGIESQWG
jgi:hypothetical protein